MKNWKAIVGVLLVFVLGMMAGGLGTIGVIRHRLVTRGFSDVIVRRLSWELRLDAGQRQQVRIIVSEAQQEMRPVRERVFENAESKIRAALRPDQQAKFDELVAKSKRIQW